MSVKAPRQWDWAGRRWYILTAAGWVPDEVQGPPPQAHAWTGLHMRVNDVPFVGTVDLEYKS